MLCNQNTHAERIENENNESMLMRRLQPTISRSLTMNMTQQIELEERLPK